MSAVFYLKLSSRYEYVLEAGMHYLEIFNAMKHHKFVSV